jgi:hypothetical protein
MSCCSVRWLSADGVSCAEDGRNLAACQCGLQAFGPRGGLLSGVEPAFSLDHGMTMSLYYKDPGGNFVELQNDNFSDWKAHSTSNQRGSSPQSGR